MATIGGIDLGGNTRWLNEFDGAAVESKQKWTEEGRLFVFQKNKDTFRKLDYDCGWQTYQTLQSLEALRDGGNALVLTHNDGRQFDVILESIDAKPVRPTASHSASKKFAVILKLMEV